MCIFDFGLNCPFKKRLQKSKHSGASFLTTAIKKLGVRQSLWLESLPLSKDIDPFGAVSYIYKNPVVVFMVWFGEAKIMRKNHLPWLLGSHRGQSNLTKPQTL